MLRSTFLASIFLATLSIYAAENPNIVIILADDMGWGDPQCYNAESKCPTPHIDRLASGGMRFTDAHTPSSVCTPTRYTLLTGRYCWRTRLKESVLDGFSPPLIEPGRETIADYLKAKGYATACIGKWHLGMQWTRLDGSLESDDRSEEKGFRSGDDIDFSRTITGGPTAVGFDSYFGISASLDMPPYCWIENDLPSPAPDTSVETTRELFISQTAGRAHSDFSLFEVLGTLKQRTIQWIEEHEAKNDEQPFFLYLPLNSPHLPVSPSSKFDGTSEAGTYGDFVVETDDYVGGVIDALETAGELENSLVLFTSDNGGLWHQWEPQEADDLEEYKPSDRAKYTAQFGHHSNAHLRGTKADIWEGGHRVPFLVHWPETVEAGTVSDEPVELTDVFATVAEIFGEEPSAETAPDSFSFLPALKGKRLEKPVRPYLVHHSLRGMFAIRKDGWKLVEKRGSGGFSTPKWPTRQPTRGPEGQLYHIEEDVQETKNLWDEEPERTAELKKLLEEISVAGRTPNSKG